jgi:hypothetical protein
MLRHSQHLSQYCVMLIRTLRLLKATIPFLQRTDFKLVSVLKAPFTSSVCVCVCVCVCICIRVCVCNLIHLRIVQYYTQNVTDFDEA